MAGFYIHIPYCRKVCYYCDFHFTVSLKYKELFLQALKQEIISRRVESRSFEFDTVYFGGGTPSVLSPKEVTDIIGTVYKNYQLAPNAEITFEANPDDLGHDYLSALRSDTPINRLSIGVQSFEDDLLRLLNRRHTAKEAYQSIERAIDHGFDNINIDLIYGIPGLTEDKWKEALHFMSRLGADHLSAYHLTFEPKTVFGYQLRKGKISPIKEENSVKQYKILIDWARQNGFDHYEISNFARSNVYSRHNMIYWGGKPYIGVGPSAHSFHKDIRRWNISNNTKYINLLKEGKQYWEQEIIGTVTKYNDYIITSFRTKWGADLQKIKEEFGKDIYDHCMDKAKKYIGSGEMATNATHLYLTENAFFISDHIISDFMLINE